jgi:hypothetical protein
VGGSEPSAEYDWKTVSKRKMPCTKDRTTPSAKGLAGTTRINQVFLATKGTKIAK